MDIELGSPWDEPKLPHMRQQRMATLLTEWYIAPRWRYYPHPHGQSPPPATLMLTDAERTAWRRLLDVAEVVPPMTTLAGARALIEHHNLAYPSVPWNESELAEQGKLRVIGDRAAISLSVIASAGDHGGFHWSLRVDTARVGIDAAALQSAARKLSVDLVSAGPLTIVKAARRVDGREDGSVLLDAATRTNDGAHLLHLWERARAVHVADFFLDGLSAQHKRMLAEHIEGIFERYDKALLGWNVDEELYSAAEGIGRRRGPTRSTYRSRIGALVEAASLFEHLHSGLPDYYYFELAGAFVECAEVGAIANLLASLPPGDTLMHALDRVVLHRPTDLATMVSHPSWRSEAAFALMRLSASKTIVSGLATGNLSKEWRSIQLDLRHICCSDMERLEIAVQLAIEDERALISGRGRLALAADDAMAPWADAMANREFAERVVTSVETFLAHESVSTETVRVALRLMPLVEKHHTDLSESLGRSIHAAYSSAMKTRTKCFSLERVGDLLAGFGNVLRRIGDAAWKEFLRPLDDAQVATASSADDSSVRYAVLGHVSNLCALALFGTAADVSDVVTEVLRLRGVTLDADARVGGFGWWEQLTMHRPHEVEEQIWLRLGRAMARHADDSKALVRECVRKLEGLALAYLLWGLGRESALAVDLRKHVRDLVAREFEGENLMLDRAINAVEALYHASLFAEAESGARKILKLIANSENRGRAFGNYQAASTRLLKATLVAENKVDEALAISMEPTSIDDVFILKNLDAISLLRAGQPQNARNLLDQVIRERPADAMASTNLVYSYIAEEDWPNAVTAARRARDASGKNLPEQVLQLEALALWHQDRFDECAQVARQLSASGRMAPEMIQMRLDLMLLTSPDYRALNADLDVLAKTDAVLAANLKARLVPAVNADVSSLVYSDLPPARIRFEERIARATDKSPTQLLLEMFHLACRSITQHPAMLQALNNEDYLTQLIAWHLEAELKRYGADAATNVRGGLGPKREGVADLVIHETAIDAHHRPLVRGEAKYWDGKATLLKNMTQVFGTANTGSELFVVALVYSRNEDFGSVLDRTREAIAEFSIDVDGEANYRCIGTVEDVTDRGLSGERLRVYKSIHELKRGGDVTNRVVYTFVLDTVSPDARAARET